MKRKHCHLKLLEGIKAGGDHDYGRSVQHGPARFGQRGIGCWKKILWFDRAVGRAGRTKLGVSRAPVLP